MKIKEITSFLETVAPLQLQETYDNAGLLTGNAEWQCTGIIVALDAIEQIVEEAIGKKCNLIIAHHPIIFGGLKKITGRSYVERTVIAAIKNDIAIYAIHTNLDNIFTGVNGKIADMLGLVNRRILLPKERMLKKLVVFVPSDHAGNIRNALFGAGAGHTGNYSECSFNTIGEGTYTAGEGASPFMGNIGQRHIENETRIEVVFPSWLENAVVKAMLQVHPYEEVAYDIIPLVNAAAFTGSGLLAELPSPVGQRDFLASIKNAFDLKVIKHTKLTGNMVKKVAVCGGAGSFLTKAAITSGADFYITSDVKYHEFFDAEDRMVLADIGHYESEQYTISLLFDILKQKYTTFAVLKTGVNTNPVQYFF